MWEADPSSYENLPPARIVDGASMKYIVLLRTMLVIMVLAEYLHELKVIGSGCTALFQVAPRLIVQRVTYLPQVPSWFEASPEDFVRYHRSLLESERVTRNLHRWLDITFGYCLKGQAAVDNKNVPLPRGGMGPDAGQRPRRW